MKKYLVHYDRVEALFQQPEIKEKEMMRLRDLMHENVLLRSFISKDHKDMWLYFQVDDAFTLREILKTLPACSQLQPNVNELEE